MMMIVIIMTCYYSKYDPYVYFMTLLTFDASSIKCLKKNSDPILQTLQAPCVSIISDNNNSGALTLMRFS